MVKDSSAPPITEPQELLEIDLLHQTPSFTRFNVHNRMHDYVKQGLAANLDAAFDRILHSIGVRDESITFDSTFKDLYYGIGIYFAFYRRHKDMAKKLFTLYSQCLDEEKMAALLISSASSSAAISLHKKSATVLSLLTYVETIDPNFVDDDNQFGMVVEMLNDIPQDTSGKDTIDVIITKALAKQYQAMCIHRRAIFAKSSDMGNAFMLIDEAITLQEQIVSRFSFIKIGLAESLHLKGVMLYRLGDLAQNENLKRQYNSETVAALTRAKNLEEEFVSETKAPHFLVATTLQSLARVLKASGRVEESFPLYERALQLQCSLFGTEVHEDIAKTWHFWAESYVMQNNHDEAVAKAFSALLVKFKITYKSLGTAQETKDLLLKSFAQLEQVSVEQALLRGSSILSALDDSEHSAQFKSIFLEMITALKAELREKVQVSRDKISIAACPATHSTRMLGSPPALRDEQHNAEAASEIQKLSLN